MRPVASWMLAAMIGIAAALAGCVQFPTEKQGIVDLRPQVAFRVTENSSAAVDSRVNIDGLDVGRVGDYLEGQNTLRVLGGNHVVRVVRDGRVQLEERVYLGDGASRTFLLN